jgi:acyl carrier protein
MNTITDIKTILASTLHLGENHGLSAGTALLGSLPELDSMAVIHLITALEEHFGITVQDDEISGATFATVGSLAAFVDDKLSQ